MFQISEKDDLVRRLESETAALREQASALQAGLEVEKARAAEAEAETERTAAEFGAIREARDKLLAEKFGLVSQMSVTAKENERITDLNVVLEGRLNDTKLELETVQVRSNFKT